MTLQGVKRKVVSVSDFRLTGRLLGKGNFARVEEAVHNVLNTRVALKIIDIREIKEKYVIRNLHREARIMSTLNHPCIAALFQTMQLSDNVYYLVTELVSGGDLCTFIIGQRYGKLEERPAKVFARQFASALAHMHSFGIVHRDLKMENVMLNAAQTQIKIVDFGLSNIWSAESPLRTHCGSPEYAAPELFVAGKEYGPEVDLWSLGIIFYGMVVGQLPFVGGRKNQLSSQERRKRLVAQINKGLGASQRQAVAPMSPEFRAMLYRLLAAEPAKRIAAKDLIIHPWITDKGRKVVQAHPFKKTNSQLQAKLVDKIGDLYKTDRNLVETELVKNPYGKLGGAFNILTYRYISELFTPESIALTVRRAESPEKSKKAAALVKSQNTLYNQCVVLLNKVSKQQVEERAKSANPALILAKNVAKLSRVKTAPAQKQSSKDNPSEMGKRVHENPVATLKALKKTASSRMNSGDNKQSPGSSVKRPLTTGAVVNALRPPKRISGPTAVQSTCPASEGERQRRRICPNSAGTGDASRPKKAPSFAALQKTRPKDPLANDPIARSIAGYLSRNIPNKMFNVSGTTTLGRGSRT